MQVYIDAINRLVMMRFDKSHEETLSNESLIDIEFCQDLCLAFQSPESFCSKTFSKYPIDTLLIYLKKTHSFYLENRLKEIEISIENLSGHQRDSSLLALIKHFFKAFEIGLSEHIRNEEEIFFPYISALMDAEETNHFHYSLDEKLELISFLLHHNDEVEKSLKKFIQVLEKQKQLANSLFGFKVLLTQLKVFELDLTIHARIEDEVLMPKALALERIILKDSQLSN